MENTTRTPCSQQRTHEIQDTFFREHVLFSFFYWREKILCVGFLFYFLVRDKKGFENTLFEIREVVKYLQVSFPRPGPLISLSEILDY